MTTLLSTRFGAKFSGTYHRQEISAFLGDSWDAIEHDLLVPALLEALRDEVNKLLPDGFFWTPATSEITYPADADVPDIESLSDLFGTAWDAVEGRLEDIITNTTSALADLREANAAEQARQEAVFDAQLAAFARAINVKKAVDKLGRAKVASVLGVTPPAVTNIISRLRVGAYPEEFSLMVVDENMVGDCAAYNDGNLGRLSLRRNAEHMMFVPDEDRAARWVALECHIDGVGTVRQESSTGDWWTFRELQ